MHASARSRLGRVGRAAGLVVAGALAATVLTGVSFADDETGQDAPAATEGKPGHHRLGGPGMGPLLHGEQVVRTPDGDFREIAVQHGTVEAVDAGSITVTSEDGYTATYTITDETTIRVDRQEADAAALAVGRSARVIADTDGNALRIGSLTEEGEEQMAERRSRFQEFREQRGEARKELMQQFGASSSSSTG
jgi:hypothetical protein